MRPSLFQTPSLGPLLRLICVPLILVQVQAGAHPFFFCHKPKLLIREMCGLFQAAAPKLEEACWHAIWAGFMTTLANTEANSWVTPEATLSTFVLPGTETLTENFPPLGTLLRFEEDAWAHCQSRVPPIPPLRGDAFTCSSFTEPGKRYDWIVSRGAEWGLRLYVSGTNLGLIFKIQLLTELPKTPPVALGPNKMLRTTVIVHPHRQASALCHPNITTLYRLSTHYSCWAGSFLSAHPGYG